MKTFPKTLLAILLLLRFVCCFGALSDQRISRCAERPPAALAPPLAPPAAPLWKTSFQQPCARTAAASLLKPLPRSPAAGLTTVDALAPPDLARPQPIAARFHLSICASFISSNLLLSQKLFLLPLPHSTSRQSASSFRLASYKFRPRTSRTPVSHTPAACLRPHSRGPPPHFWPLPLPTISPTLALRAAARLALCLAAALPLCLGGGRTGFPIPIFPGQVQNPISPL